MHSSCMKPHELIKLLADRTGKPTLQLAKDIHKATFQGTLHKLINGNVPKPTQPTAKRIADYFGLPLDAMYDERVATQIAIERGLVYPQPVAAAPPVAARESTPAAPTPITRARRTLPPAILDRMQDLSQAQMEALTAMVKAYLDGVAPQVSAVKIQRDR
jgi:hypothetical protein